MLAAYPCETRMTYRFFSISYLLLFSTILSGTTGKLTLLITGQASENVNKDNLASLFVHSYNDTVKESPADVFVFANGDKIALDTEDNHLVSGWGNQELASNVTTLVVTNVGIDQMSSGHLDILRRLITNDSALVAIEIGNPRIETRELLERRVTCPMRSRASITSPNVVYFCNNALPEMLSILLFEKPYFIKPLDHKDTFQKTQRWLIWPNILASAAKLDERSQKDRKREHHDHHHSHPHHTHHKHPHRSHHSHSTHHDKDVEEIVDMIMEDIVEQGIITGKSTPHAVTAEKKVDKKKACKYRKSCYETGIKPDIDDSSVFNFRHWWAAENEEGDEDKEVEVKWYSEEENLPLMKLQCKYRHSCYHKHGIPFKEKSIGEEKIRPVLAYKAVNLQQGKKKTLKEIAAEAIKTVEESIEKAAKRPHVKIVEKHMTAHEEKLLEKLRCKYRKSCYETGEVPIIEGKLSLPLPIKIFSTESVDSESNQINFDELEQLEKKLYCKYRKSCYETGVKPDIEPEIFIDSLKDLVTIPEQVETRKMTLQEKCKYRKSCYETGIVPIITPKLEAVISKEVSSVIPTNAQDLRLFCKYRKSCYAKVHDSATVETIKLLRKRRQIEKEVRRRKVGRMKSLRKSRGEAHVGQHRKAARRASDEKIDEVEEKNLEDSKLSEERKVRKEPENVHEESVEMKERSDSEGKKVKVKKAKPQAKESILPETAKPKDASPPKKERKSKKVKPEKQISKTKPIKESEEEADEEDSTEKDAKPAESTPLKEVPGGITEKSPKEKRPAKEDVKEDQKEGKGLGKAVQTMNKLIEEMKYQQEQQQLKEFCKYRKSCYETGKRPEIKQSFDHLVEMFKDHVDRETGEVPVIAKTEADKKFDCKYRKSCYKTGHLTLQHEAQSGEHNTVQHVPEGSVSGIGLDRYKKSGKCSPYYYSCRAILGLPPKERAPIGPNGKRLCRKKPLSSA